MPSFFKHGKKVVACGCVAAGIMGMTLYSAPPLEAKSFSDYGTHDRLDDVNRELDRLQGELKKMNEALSLGGSGDQGLDQGLDQLIGFQEEIRALGRDWAKLYEGLDGFSDFQGEDYIKYMNDLIRETENAMLYSAKAQGLTSQLPEDADDLRRLQDASKRARGTLGAQQAANEMTALMIEQLMRLQQMIGEANNAQAAYWQSEMEHKAAQRDFDQKYAKLPEKSASGAKARIPGLDD